MCKNKVIDECVFDPDSEISNEPAFSVDTGCDSSLACSDVDKGFFSSEYSASNSPLSFDTLMMRKEVTKAVSVATSPITVPCTQDSGTNPMERIDYKNVGVQHDSRSEERNIRKSCKNIDIQCDISSEQLCRNVEVQCELKSMDKEIKSIGIQCDGVSEKTNIDIHRYLEAATQSDFTFGEFNIVENNKASVTADHTKSPKRNCKRFSKEWHKIDKEKSIPLIAEEEQSNQGEKDFEVNTILKEMRLDFGKITPIPVSPIPHSSKNNHLVPYVETDHQELSSQVSVLTKTVMAIASALKGHGINLSNENENIANAKDALSDKNLTNEVNVSEEFDNDFDVHTEEIKVKKTSQNICSSLNKKSKEPQDLSAVESENNLQHSFRNKQHKNETVEVENTLDGVSFKSLSFLNDGKDDPNNENKSHEKERTRVIKKNKKITKLEKLRKNVLPKYKIKKDLTLLPKNISSKTLNRKSLIYKDTNKKLKSMEILNNKAAYEKALRVVAEIRQKEKDNLPKKFGKKIFLKPNTKKKVVSDSSKQIQCSDVRSKRLLNDIRSHTHEDCSNQIINKSLSSLTSPKILSKQSISNGDDILQVSKNGSEISKLNTDIKKCINADNSESDRNVVSTKFLEDLETVKKQELRKNAHLNNKIFNVRFVPNEQKDCQNSENILINNQEESLLNANALNKYNGVRQSTRLSIKRLSESEAENKCSKRQKRVSESLNQFTLEDEMSTLGKSRISDENSDIDKIKLNTLQNHLVVQIRRLSSEEIETNTKQIHEFQEYSPDNKSKKHIYLPKNNTKTGLKSYHDLDMFSENTNNMTDYSIQNHKGDKRSTTQKGYFCQILDKYMKNKKNPKPISEETIKNVCIELDINITQIINLKNNEINEALKKFAESIQNVNIKHLTAAIVAFLQSPKKIEDIICKTSTPPAPPMAKSEQILLYLLKHLNSQHANVNLFNMVMDSIAYKLFKLNNIAPSFEEIESLSHFYAVLCRYTRAKNKLRLFILDAMYCLSYKAIPVIKQCLDVWLHILPLAHMGLAKSPLVITLVYLLHFYRCDDQSGRVQNIRMLLRKRYSYDMGDWNETKILEMFKDAITHIREIPIEEKMLRTSLILIAKRNGVEWCQKNIVKKLLLPMIENENAPKTRRGFCVSLLGAVMRPYPKHMRLHCEIVVNQLFVMLDQEESPQFQEALFTGLIYLSRHSLNQVVAALLTWKPLNVSPALEELLKDFVQERSLKSWHSILLQNAK